MRSEVMAGSMECKIFDTIDCTQSRDELLQFLVAGVPNRGEVGDFRAGLILVKFGFCSGRRGG